MRSQPFLYLSALLAAGLILAACTGAGRSTPAGTAVSNSPTAVQEVTPLPTRPQVSPAVTEPIPANTRPAADTPAPADLPTTPPAEPTLPPAAPAASLPDPAGYEWKQVAFGLQLPIGLVNAGDGSNRLFVVEKAGTIRIIQDGQVVEQPFLDIRDRVGSAQSERGLLGLAFSPKFSADGWFFVNYTDKNGNTVISRFTFSKDTGSGDPNSEHVLLTQEQPYPNHNGGQLAFGPDGFLYIGLGDGGSAGDPQNNAQNTGTFLGKILRIDPLGGDPYAIPTGNPFTDGGGKPEVWAFGLRNPWRFSFDMQTGDLYIADVGQNQWEEIDFLPAGSTGQLDFGWRIKEGTHSYEGASTNFPLIDPVFEYDHGQGCSVTGGYVYRGASLPEWQGVYLFGDYCSGNVWGLLRKGDSFEGKAVVSAGEYLDHFLWPG